MTSYKNLFSMGNKFRRDGEFETAIDLYTLSIALNPRHYISFLNRGLAKSKIGDYLGSIHDYDECLDLNPWFAKAYYNRGISKKLMGDIDGAIDDYTACLDCDGTYARAYYNRGTIYSMKGHDDFAVDDYDACIALDPSHYKAFLHRGNANIALGRITESLNDYTQIISMDEEFSLAYYNRGLLRSNTGDLEGAVIDYTFVIAIDPSPKMYCKRAKLKIDLDDVAGAIDDFKNGINLDANYIKSYIWLGDVFRSQGDFATAEEWYMHGTLRFQQDSHIALDWLIKMSPDRKFRWSKERHFLYPKEFKDKVILLLLIHSRKSIIRDLSKDILFQFIHHLSYLYFTEPIAHQNLDLKITHNTEEQSDS